jgi:hypothetical protein
MLISRLLPLHVEGAVRKLGVPRSLRVESIDDRCLCVPFSVSGIPWCDLMLDFLDWLRKSPRLVC